MTYKGQRKRVLCVGDLNFDVIAFLKSRPRGSHDEFLSSVKPSPGGGAANVAVGLARLGISSVLVSRVGRDLFGRYLLKKLMAEKVETSSIQIDPDAQTGFVLALVSRGGERTLYSFRGANANLNHEQIKFRALSDASFTYLSGYSFLEDPQRATSLKLMDFARQVGSRISVDLGPELSGIERADLTHILEKTNLLFISHKEALRLYRTRSWTYAIDHLLRAGPETVALKSGEKGCYVGRDQIRLHVKAFDVRAVDTTGAGDAFNTGFLYGMINDWSIIKMAVAGSAVAALKITSAGAVNGLPSRERVTRFLAKHKVP